MHLGFRSQLMAQQSIFRQIVAVHDLLHMLLLANAQRLHSSADVRWLHHMIQSAVIDAWQHRRQAESCLLPRLCHLEEASQFPGIDLPLQYDNFWLSGGRECTQKSEKTLNITSASWLSFTSASQQFVNVAKITTQLWLLWKSSTPAWPTHTEACWHVLNGTLSVKPVSDVAQLVKQNFRSVRSISHEITSDASLCSAVSLKTILLLLDFRKEACVRQWQQKLVCCYWCLLR